jgi:hypothetical protein
MNLKIISSSFALMGGILLANNIPISKYGFIFLAISSSTMCISSYLSKDYFLCLYSSILFFFVDLLGVYNWIVK